MGGGATETGAVTPELIVMMTALAQGGVGLIITSHTYVQPEGISDNRCFEPGFEGKGVYCITREREKD